MAYTATPWSASVTAAAGLAALAVALLQAPAEAQVAGVSIRRDNAFLAMGQDSDVVFRRVGSGQLLVNATATALAGKVEVENLYVLNTAGSLVSVRDLVHTEPVEAGTWTTVFDFGTRGGICSVAAAEAVGIEFQMEGGNDVSMGCEDDYFGPWCASGCTGVTFVPLDFNSSQYARIQLAVSNTHATCQGFLHHVDGSSGNETLLWNNEQGVPVDPVVVTTGFQEGDQLKITETGTCIVDIYNVDIFIPDVGIRVEELEARVAYLEEALFNHSLSLTELEKECDWQTLHTFGSDGDICSSSAMAAAGWTLTDIDDSHCKTDYFSPWCGGSCSGAVSFELPASASAARLVVGHSYGGSCQGSFKVYHTDGSTTTLYTHGAGDTFDPERLEFTYEEGDVVEVVELGLCIIDLYSLAVLPKSC